MKTILYDANGKEWKQPKESKWLLLIPVIAVLVGTFVILGDKPKPTVASNDPTLVSSSVFTFGPPIPAEKATGFRTKPPVVKAPADRPPAKIILGAYTFNVRYTTKKYMDVNNCLAFMDPKTQEIWLTPETKDIREEVLHELMHAALEAHRAEFPSEWYLHDENTFVTPLAPEILQTLKDNPELEAWLFRSPK